MIQLRNGMHTHTGSLSTDSLKPGDIGRALCQFLDYYDNTWYFDALDAYPSLYDATADREHSFWELETGGEAFIADAFERAQELLPDGYYIGSHPGDGADIGIWECE
jgi:hypothetical protein